MKVLALSPHTDDIELGCGGYLTKLHEQGHAIYSVSLSCQYGDLNLKEEFEASQNVLGAHAVWIYDFPTRKFQEHRQGVLDQILEERRLIEPDLVLLPSSSDIHQDHKVVHEEGVRAFSKECSVLAYELPWNCRDFKPNFYVELKREHLDKKWDILYEYKSQRSRAYFDFRFTEGWARTRGQQIKKEFAEAFEVITWID